MLIATEFHCVFLVNSEFRNFSPLWAKLKDHGQINLFFGETLLILIKIICISQILDWIEKHQLGANLEFFIYDYLWVFTFAWQMSCKPKGLCGVNAIVFQSSRLFLALKTGGKYILFACSKKSFIRLETVKQITYSTWGEMCVLDELAVAVFSAWNHFAKSNTSQTSALTLYIFICIDSDGKAAWILNKFWAISRSNIGQPHNEIYKG